MSATNLAKTNSAGRYDGRKTNTRLVPGGRAQTSARIRNVQPVEAAVDDPFGKDRILVTVNRRVDVLEMERSHGRISEAAYRTGQIVQAVMQRMGYAGLGSADLSGASRGDPAMAIDLKIERMLTCAKTAQAMHQGISRQIGMIDTRLLRRVLGERLSWGQCAEFEGKGGERGSSYVAARFRDALEDLARAWTTKGRIHPFEDRFSEEADVAAIDQRRRPMRFEAETNQREIAPGTMIRVTPTDHRKGDPVPFMPASTTLTVSGTSPTCEVRVVSALGGEAAIETGDGRRFRMSHLKPTEQCGGYEPGLGIRDWVIREEIRT